MIQRVQSLYLLLIIGLTASCFFFPLAYVLLSEMEIYAVGLSDVKNAETLQIVEGVKSFFFIGPLLILLFSTITLINYKNRGLQLRFGKISYLVHLAYIIAIVFLLEGYVEKMEKLAGHDSEFETKIGYAWSFFVPSVTLVFTFLANRAIKKDEDLVSSVDRLR